MSIRLRDVPGVGLVALCAARSVAKPGDLYLDDAAHHALSDKFSADFAAEGIPGLSSDPAVAAAREVEESNNPNREWWDRTYANANIDG